MHQTTVIPIDSDPLLPAALAAIGFTVKANVHLFPDAPSQAAHRKVTWMCSERSSDGLHDGKELVPAWHSKTLLKTHPDHPLLAGLMALQTRMVLNEWKKGTIGMPHVVILPGHKLARAVPPSARSQNADIAQYLGMESEGMSLDHAAAAITAGHAITAIRPFGCLVTNKGAFGPVGASMLAAAAAQIEADAHRSATMPLPGYAPGEHPFLYALAAIQQARALGIAAEKKDPTLHLNSPSGKVALVSQSIMQAPGAFKEHVHKHIR